MEINISPPKYSEQSFVCQMWQAKFWLPHVAIDDSWIVRFFCNTLHPSLYAFTSSFCVYKLKSNKCALCRLVLSIFVGVRRTFILQISFHSVQLSGNFLFKVRIWVLYLTRTSKSPFTRSFFFLLSLTDTLHLLLLLSHLPDKQYCRVQTNNKRYVRYFYRFLCCRDCIRCTRYCLNTSFGPSKKAKDT